MILCFITSYSLTQNTAAEKLVTVADGWAGNSVNAVVFRKSALITFKDTQYIAFYDKNQFVVLGKRRSGELKWQLKTTAYQGNTADAHNSISIMIDGAGYLHMAWDHHNNPLNYCRSIVAGSLELTEKISMTGLNEQHVTYPEFYRMPDGNLLFFYRSGESGNGNLVLNEYDIYTKKWKQLQSNLIDGEGHRNAYWQACTDVKGTIHLSWVWRETPDVASNHDMCYARSNDGGKTWEKSTGEKYILPVTAATAEYAFNIPQHSELINQTSMFADAKGHPYIGSYWTNVGDKVPQYHLVYKKDRQWLSQNLRFRRTAFSLSGTGTKRIPISRPQVLVWQLNKKDCAAIIFRDAERGNRLSAAITMDVDKGQWIIKNLLNMRLGSWEPAYDTELWKEKGLLNLFVQKVEQADGEGKANMQPQPVQVLEYDIKK